MPSSTMRKFVLAVFFVSFAGLTGCDSLGINDIPIEKMKEKYATGGDKYFSYNGMQVRYRDEGSGPVVILLHGICSSLETWDGWLPSMKGEFRVIRIDVPGFGLTGPAPDKKQYQRENAVGLLNDFASYLNLDRFSIGGNSLGGYIAWNYAVTYPQKVTKLILIDPVGYNQELPWILRYTINPFIRPFSRRMMPSFFFDIAVTQVFGDKSRATPAIKKRFFELAMREGNKGAYVDIFSEMRKQNETSNLGKEIPNIKAPTLVMWGTKDEWVPFENFEKWKKDLPAATYIAYDGIGHLGMEEIPEITVQATLQFLREPDGAAPAMTEAAAD